MSSLANHTETDENYCRFIRLLTDDGTSVLRKLLEAKAGLRAPNVDAFLQLQEVRFDLMKLCPVQFHEIHLSLLFPPEGQAVDLKTWDITLLCFVLMTVGNLLPLETVKVREIKEVHDTFSGPGTSMDDATYAAQWRNLIDIISDLLTFCNDAQLQIVTNKEEVGTEKEEPKKGIKVTPGVVGTIVAVGAGVTAVVAAPVVLAGVGFGAAGVTAGSIAAAIQGPAVASGSLFALCQSAGAAGLAASTQAIIGGTVAGVKKVATLLVKK